MAEHGAHLTQTVNIKPSIFDFVAQEALNDLLHPSAKKIVDFLALGRHSFINVSKWFDEYFLISHFLLQMYYLKRYGATFSEKFYGLQRVSLKETKTKALGNREFFFSLFAVSVVPYLMSKLNNLSDKMSLDNLPSATKKKKIILMKTVIYCNSSLNISYQLWKFVQHLRYLSGKTDISSPLLWIAGVKLKYAKEFEADYWTFKNLLPQVLQRSLEIGAFFMQFMQWWQTNKESHFNALPVPPPPEKNKHASLFSDKCPICLKKRNIDTVLSTSGYVFCFNCITSYLKEHNQCPVTKLPATVHNLIRIYSSS